MYICVIFKQSKVIKVVPSGWRQNYSNAEESSDDSQPNNIQTIFYSSNAARAPNFELPLSIEFDESEDRCYLGYVLKKDISEAVRRNYMDRRRPIIPVNYFPRKKHAPRRPRNRSRLRQSASINQPLQLLSIAEVAPVHREIDLQYAAINQQIEQIGSSTQQFNASSPLNAERIQPNRDAETYDAGINQQIKQSVNSAHQLDASPPLNAELIQLNGDMEMCDAEICQQIHRIENSAHVSPSPIEQGAKPNPLTSRLAEEVEQYKCLLAKREKQIKLYQSTVNFLNTKLGPEDLTVNVQKHYEDILLSSAEEGSDSDDSDENRLVEQSTNKENISSNVHGNVLQTDMNFSFSHQFILNEQKVRCYLSVKIEMPEHAVKMLKALNKTAVFNTMIGDGKFIETLLKCVFNASTLKMATYDTLAKPKIAFIRDTFIARLQSSKDGVSRLNRFAELINRVCTKEQMQRN